VIEYPHHAWQLAQAMYPDHGCGYCVIGGYVYRGHQFPALQGVYVYGDYNFGTVWGLRYDYAAKQVTAHGKLGDSHGYIDSFGADGAGEIYALMQDGKIFHVVAR
jgi:quinoprotein glucose dehydrogenase